MMNMRSFPIVLPYASLLGVIHTEHKSVIAEGKLSGTTWTITLPSDTDKALINKIGTSLYADQLHRCVSGTGRKL